MKRLWWTALTCGVACAAPNQERATDANPTAAAAETDAEATETAEAAEASEVPPTLEALVGTWKVSLHHSPTEPPSETTLVITDTTEGILTGTFYDTPFIKARAIVHDDEVLFSLVTADKSGEYLHSGELEDGSLEGQTHSVGRDFLMAWTAERVAN